MRITLILVALLLTTTMMSAQSWKRLSKTAEKLMQKGEYAEAGDTYMEAWKVKPKKKHLAYRAGNAYYLVKDYNKAAKAYQVVKDNNKDYDRAGLRYARCLKSMEQYDEASREFVYFINSYKGDDAESLAELVQTEILGCEMAIKNTDQMGSATVTHLGESINSDKIEYAPLPYTEDILYFSSDKDGTSKIYRSQFLEGEWTNSKATEAIFSKVTREHYGNVTFAPDNQRFYFTQCDFDVENGSKCDIYMVESRENGMWSEPIPLPAYINDAESTNTHPNVIQVEDKEVIYFVSNRKGGKGGMDIWYTTRDLNSPDLDFTFPKNLGGVVNTAGNEVTPFYDVTTQTLYFSSDGHIGYGGLDIFKSTGNETDWATPENMGKPINSPQDDKYFVFNEMPDNGFLVSNRKDGLSKLTTTNDDIFQFGEEMTELAIKGLLQDDKGNSLEDVELSLYEISGNRQKRMITQQTVSRKFYFPLIENKAYQLVAKKQGYVTSNLEFEMLIGSSSLRKNFELKNLNVVPATPKIEEPVVSAPKPVVSEPSRPAAPKIEEPVVSAPKPVVSKPSRPAAHTTVTQPTSTVITSTPINTTKPNATDASWYPNHGGKTKSQPVITHNNTGVTNTSVSHHSSGTYYKVQMEAVKHYKPSVYNNVSGFGFVETEAVPNKNLSRVMLGDFYNKRDAIAARNKVRNNGFARAYVVEYKNGKRVRIKVFYNQ